MSTTTTTTTMVKQGKAIFFEDLVFSIPLPENQIAKRYEEGSAKEAFSRRRSFSYKTKRRRRRFAKAEKKYFKRIRCSHLQRFSPWNEDLQMSF